MRLDNSKLITAKTEADVRACTRTVRNKTTSYVEIRNHISFKTTFKIKSKNNARVQCSVRWGLKMCDHVM